MGLVHPSRGKLLRRNGHDRRNEQLGFLSGIVGEKGCSTFHIPVTDVYPDCPDDLVRGKNALVQMLQGVMMVLSEQAIFFFHPVDTWPPVDIRTGKKMDLF
jgi:hypothetical protein